ncbi:DNA repair protein rad16 [Basidiobolus ranarum]|uniref:DNA repair protein rad16 n=1 Tax=Basidiobolus ranarum TaxID=34480 RepID=A0ABR2VVA6_9FUNG
MSQERRRSARLLAKVVISDTTETNDTDTSSTTQPVTPSPNGISKGKRKQQEVVIALPSPPASSTSLETPDSSKKVRRSPRFPDTQQNASPETKEVKPIDNTPDNGEVLASSSSSVSTRSTRSKVKAIVSYDSDDSDFMLTPTVKRKGKNKEIVESTVQEKITEIVENETESEFDESLSNQNSDASADEAQNVDDTSDDNQGFVLRTRRNRSRSRGRTAITPEARARMRRQSRKQRLENLHPELATVWEELDKKEEIDRSPIDQPPDLKLSLLPFQKEGVAWMRGQEYTEFHGGILADEMGMGKTIQMISLLLSEPRGKPNLVVAPTVALMQWHAELTTHTDSLSVLIFHGQNRTEEMEELKKHDVVLTTYSIIESAFRKQEYGFKRKGELTKEKSLLHKIGWYRIVLDEAHNIKDRACNTARSVFALESSRKWSLSGTPLQNRVGELYSLLRFLRADPYSYYYCQKCPCKSLSWKFSDRRHCDICHHTPMSHVCWWNQEILKPIQNFGALGEGQLGFQKLGKLLDRMMLRRTKLEKADDLGLPPRNVTIRFDYFNEEEEDIYESLYTDSKRRFSTYVQQGTVLNNYANIFDLLMKMRQVVNHPDLLLSRGKNKLNALVCGICNEEPEDPIVARCKHVFCREDANQYIQSSLEEAPLCPICFARLTIDLTQPTYEIPYVDQNPGVDDKQNFFIRSSIVNRIDMSRWRSSTKIEALVEELTNLRKKDSTIKSIVFSQFVNFLDLIQWRLNRAGFSCCRLDGRMGPMQRDAVIKAFMTKPELTVFLISLKAGGVALNLTEASQVFIMDPWWNPAVEDQAMDRIHRLGQHRPIRITRLIVENSIESRIIQLQEKKKALFDSTIGKDMAALSRLSEEDLRFLFVL